MRALAALLALLALACIAGAASGLVIEDCKRTIDAAGYAVRNHLELHFRNDGAEPATSVLLCDRRLHRAAFLELHGGPADVPKLKWRDEAEAPKGAPEGVACRRFELAEPLAPGAAVELHAFAALTHVLRPEPAEVRQRDPQHVLLEAEAQLVSPYRVEKQTTEVKLGLGGVQSWTEVEPSKRSGGRITYGPYEAVEPWGAQPISVHYENNTPFTRVTRLEREVEVSHWGSVYFEERYAVSHAGAKVVGEWSRFDLSTKPKEFGRVGVPAFGGVLPSVAHSLYFRDEIGNISSSEVRLTKDALHVNLIPRYPLFGGWAAKFVFGWSLPLGAVVGREVKTGRMAFSAPLGPALRDLVVDELVVRVVLPEGARDPQVSSEVRLAGPPEHETKVTYLDVMGRPVVVLRARNVVPDMSQPFTVTYSYSSLGLLQKPLLLVAGIGSVFAVAMALNRGSKLASSPSSASLASKAHAS